MNEPDCPLCDAGFPLSGVNHIPTQSKGMIPVMRCRKLVRRGEIKKFRQFLNAFHVLQKHRNGRYKQLKRQYGDYLYSQDRDKFMAELCEWLVNQ